MNIEQIYSRNIVRASSSCTLKQAAELMRQHHVGALLVTGTELSAGEAIGIVTDRDLVLQGMAEGLDPARSRIGEIMRRGLSTIPLDAGVAEALRAMRESGVRRLCVTDGATRLLGIVSLDDIFAALAAELGDLAGIIESERSREAAIEGAELSVRR